MTEYFRTLRVISEEAGKKNTTTGTERTLYLPASTQSEEECVGWKRTAPCCWVRSSTMGHIQPSVLVHKQQPCHTNSRSPP